MKKIVSISYVLVFMACLCLAGCGGGSDGEEDYIPTSDPDNWSIEKAASPDKPLDAITMDSEQGIVESAFGNNGTFVSRQDGGWLVETSVGSADIRDVEKLSSDAMWVVGSDGAILFYDGESWTEQSSGTTETLASVSAMSAPATQDDGSFTVIRYAWVAGENGTILYFNNESWAPMASGTTENLNSIDMNDLTTYLTGTYGWAVGDKGTILYYDGTSWTTQESGVTSDLHDVSISYTSTDMSDVSVYAVGDGGVVLHYDGTSWTQMESGTAENLYGIASFPDDSAMAVGSAGTALFYNAATWSLQNSGVTTDIKELYLLASGNYRGAVAVGADGSIIANRPTGQGTMYWESTYISNDTNEGYAADDTWIHVINAGSDFGKRENWPYWTTSPSGTGKLQGGHEPYRLRSGQSIYLFFGHHSSKATYSKSLAFNLIYSYDYDWDKMQYRNTLDQRYCFQLRGSTCSVGGENGKYVSNSPQATKSNNINYIATVSTKVSQSDYDFIDSVAEKACSWMRIDTSTVWGNLIKKAMKAGLGKLFSSYYAVYKNYEVSFTNWAN